MKNIARIAVLYIVPLVLFTLAGGIGTFVFLRLHPSVLGLSTENHDIVLETNILLSKIDTLTPLPKDEIPTIATVLDTKTLPNQPIFTNTQNGDKIVIYPKSKKVIVYRPRENRIVDIGEFETTSEVSTSSAKLVQSGKLSVVLLNGTDVSNITTSFESLLSSKESGIEVTNKLKANESNYEHTLVVDLTGNNADLIKRIATEMHLTTSVWPDTELKPASAEIAIIVGTDQTQ